DAEINLQYNRARYYDPTTQRWLSQDPLGFDAGDSNLYRYVNNGPTAATDPSGFQEYDRWARAQQNINDQKSGGNKSEAQLRLKELVESERAQTQKIQQDALEAIVWQRMVDNWNNGGKSAHSDYIDEIIYQREKDETKLMMHLASYAPGGQLLI